jgi:hypothetical protein
MNDEWEFMEKVGKYEVWRHGPLPSKRYRVQGQDGTVLHSVNEPTWRKAGEKIRKIADELRAYTAAMEPRNG